MKNKHNPSGALDAFAIFILFSIDVAVERENKHTVNGPYLHKIIFYILYFNRQIQSLLFR